MFNRKQKEPQPTENKFAGKRKFHGRAGMPQTTLKRLEDFYELLQCDPDEEGYVMTTYGEITELTHMDTNMLTVMLQNGMVIRRTTGRSPKFKYKWDTITPTIDMAVKLLEERATYQAKMGTKGEPKSDNEEDDVVIDDTNTEDITVAAASSALLDYVMKDDILHIRVNLKMIDADAKKVITSVMKALVNG